jgi:hypothetical protein
VKGTKSGELRSRWNNFSEMEDKMWRSLVIAVCSVSFCLAATAPDSEWSDWKPTPNFPGIQIRVICKIYLAAGDVSNWEYQFLNNYRTRVQITYREEKRESTPQKLIPSTPGTFFLHVGEKSDVYDNYVIGSCNRKLYISVDSVEVDGGAKIAPRFAGKGFSIRAAGLAATEKTTASHAKAAGGSSSNATERPTRSAAAESDSTERVFVGSAWVCHINYIDFSNNQPVRSLSEDMSVTFTQEGIALKNDSQWGFFGHARWRRNDSSVLILLPNSFAYGLEGTMVDLNSIHGRVVSKFPADPSRTEGTFSCQR